MKAWYQLSLSIQLDDNQLPKATDINNGQWLTELFTGGRGSWLVDGISLLRDDSTSDPREVT